MSCRYKDECPSCTGWCEGLKQDFSKCVEFLISAYENEKRKNSVSDNIHMFEITRLTQIKTNDLKIGDQIHVSLKDFGLFTATVQQISYLDYTFMFDTCISMYQMNLTDTNSGGFDVSLLYSYLNQLILPAFPYELRARITGISLPSYGQIIRHDEYCGEYLMPDKDDVFPLMMENKKNRIACFNNKIVWYWLRNSANPDTVSNSSFAAVNSCGGHGCVEASKNLGVRPIFIVKKGE